VLYLSHTRLMLESEHTINDNAANGPVVPRRVCAQLLSEPLRYDRWRVRHEARMSAVASARVRQRQVLALRAIALEQIHGSALVRYLRDCHIVGEARDQTLREFFGIVDAREATLLAHRDYLLAASSQICAVELLDLADDRRGVELLTEYEQAYGQFFGMFCESARAKQGGEPYLLVSLLPEVRSVAASLRRRVFEGDSRRTPRRAAQPPPPRGLSILSHSLVAHRRP
jgi:hypothetical protein